MTTSSADCIVTFTTYTGEQEIAINLKLVRWASPNTEDSTKVVFDKTDVVYISCDFPTFRNLMIKAQEVIGSTD